MNTAEHQLKILLEFGKVINKTKSLNNVLESMATFARDILGADRCSIFVYDKNSEELWSKVAHGTDPIHISSHKGVAGYAALSQDTQIVVDAYNDYRFNPDVDKVTGYLTQSILAVPLLDNQDNTIGVFQALNKKESVFTNIDAEMLLLISNYAASAIENAILYEAVGRDALLDEGECGMRCRHGTTVDNSPRIDNWRLSKQTIHHQRRIAWTD